MLISLKIRAKVAEEEHRKLEEQRGGEASPGATTAAASFPSAATLQPPPVGKPPRLALFRPFGHSENAKSRSFSALTRYLDLDTLIFFRLDT